MHTHYHNNHYTVQETNKTIKIILHVKNTLRILI